MSVFPYAVEIRTKDIDGGGCFHGCYDNPVEAAYKLLHLSRDAKYTMFSLRCHFKKSNMGSTRFRLSLKPPVLPDLKDQADYAGWNTVSFRTRSATRVRWNATRPYGTARRSTAIQCSAASVARRLKTHWYFRKPLMLVRI